MLTENYRTKYQQLVKHAKENGTQPMMQRIYLARLVAEYKREKAAVAAAALESQIRNYI